MLWVSLIPWGVQGGVNGLSVTGLICHWVEFTKLICHWMDLSISAVQINEVIKLTSRLGTEPRQFDFKAKFKGVSLHGNIKR